MTKVLHKSINKASVIKSGLIALTPSMTMTASNTVFAADGEIDHHGVQKDDTVSITGDGEGISAGGQLGGNGVSNGAQAMNLILNKVRIFVLGFVGFSIIAMLASFTLHALELAFSSGNPSKRPQHVQAIGIDFVVMAILGALSWIAGIAYNAI